MQSDTTLARACVHGAVLPMLNTNIVQYTRNEVILRWKTTKKIAVIGQDWSVGQKSHPWFSPMHDAGSRGKKAVRPAAHAAPASSSAHEPGYGTLHLLNQSTQWYGGMHQTRPCQPSCNGASCKPAKARRRQYIIHKHHQKHPSPYPRTPFLPRPHFTLQHENALLRSETLTGRTLRLALSLREE